MEVDGRLGADQLAAYFTVLEVGSLLQQAVAQQLRDDADVSPVQFQTAGRIGVIHPGRRGISESPRPGPRAVRWGLFLFRHGETYGWLLEIYVVPSGDEHLGHNTGGTGRSNSHSRAGPANRRSSTYCPDRWPDRRARPETGNQRGFIVCTHIDRERTDSWNEAAASTVLASMSR